MEKKEGRNMLMALPMLAPAAGPCSQPGAPVYQVVPGCADSIDREQNQGRALSIPHVPMLGGGELLQWLLGEGWEW